MRDHLVYLATDPLPYRKLNYTRPGQDRCTLYEADDYIVSRLQASGYDVEREGVPGVQAFRTGPSTLCRRGHPCSQRCAHSGGPLTRIGRAPCEPGVSTP